MTRDRQMTVQIQTKAVVTVAEMSRMVGLSRARFYQLIGTAFPHPVYDVTSRRPLYVEEQQEVCLEVRRRNCGVNGKPVLFYARRVGAGAPRASASTPASKPTPKTRTHQHQVDPIHEGVKGCGLGKVTLAEVRAAVEKKFPAGTGGLEEDVVVKEVFLHLMGQNSSGSAG